MNQLAPWLAVALILTSCAKKEDEAIAASERDGVKSEATAAATAPPPDNPSRRATGAASAAASASPDMDRNETPLGAVSLPDMGNCTKRCVAQNQMRAVAPEQIETDCQKTCHAECLSFCADGQGDRPVGFEDTCRADCDEQRDRLQRRR